MGIEGGDGQNVTSVLLHPLVILNVSDQWTRAQVAGANSSSHRTVGALLGTQVGKLVTVHSSFAVPWDGTTEGLDPGYLAEKAGWLKQVHEGYEVLGWYSAGGYDLGRDMRAHAALMGLEMMAEVDPLYLAIDVQTPQSQGAIQSLPIKVFHAEFRKGSDGALSRVFQQLPFVIETEESERVAVDELARKSSSAKTGASSAFTSHLATLDHSISHMTAHVDLLLGYLRRLSSGTVAPDPALLRRVSVLCATLPSSHGDAFSAASASEHCDTLLVALLHSLTKASVSFGASLSLYRPFVQLFEELTRERPVDIEDRISDFSRGGGSRSFLHHPKRKGLHHAQIRGLSHG